MTKHTNKRRQEREQDKKSKSQGLVKLFRGIFRRIRKSGIRIRLYAAFAIPVLLLAVFGIIAYKKTSEAIIINYEHSAQETLNMAKDNIALGIESVTSKSFEIINGDTVKKYYNKADVLSREEEAALFEEMIYEIETAKKANQYIYNIHIFGSKGSGYSTGGDISQDFYEDFLKSEEGQRIDGASERFLWSSNHNYLDKELENVFNAYSMTLVRKLSENNGFIMVDMPSNLIIRSLSKLPFGEDSIIGLIAPGGKETLVNTDETKVFGELSYFKELDNTLEHSGFSIENYQKEKHLFLYSKIGSTGAYLCVLVPEHTILQKADEIKLLIVVFLILAGILAAIISALIAGGIAKEIKKLTKSIAQASKGDLTTEFSTKRTDEFKALSSSLSDMMGNMRSLIEKVAFVGTKVSSSADALSLTSSDILDSTKSIAQAIEEIGEGVVQQASDTEQCSSRMSELSDRINHVYSNSYEIEKIAQSTKTIVGEGITTVDELNHKASATTEITHEVIREIEELELQSRSIENMVGVINEITTQTNLLALNASIEAARAGTAGRGFAVVAEEIRKLADQSVNASNHIKDTIHEIQAKTKGTVASAKQAEDIVESQMQALTKTVTTFESINLHVGKLVNNLNQITEGMKNIEAAKSETMDAIQNISAVSQQTAASSEEVSATAITQINSVEYLSNSAAELAEEAEELKKEIQLFRIS